MNDFKKKQSKSILKTLKKMKKSILIIILLAFNNFAQAQNMKGMDMGKKETQQVTYTCVMHPEIHVTKPGKCPKCGMNLVEKKE